jgi:putative lipoprotein
MRYEDYLRQIIFAFMLAAAFIMLMMLQGCRTKYVSVPEYHNVYINKHDTLTKHDSVYQEVFVDRYVKGDTIYLTKTKVDYRFRNLYKTRYRDSLKIDSIRVPYPVERKLNKWENLKMEVGGWAIGGLSAVVIALIAYIVTWLVRRYK